MTPEEYTVKLALASELIALDPDPETPEFKQLLMLVELITVYEARHFPIGPT